LEKNNSTLSQELKSLKEDFGLLMDINNTYGTENEELKRKIENDGNEFEHLSKKAKGKRKVIQISDADDDIDDDLMEVKSNATDELVEEPNEKDARVC
jgi:regulator of replication initiation timing